MAGFANDIVYANNGDFSIAGSSKGQAANGLLTNGQMWIGTTSTNVGGTHINVGTLTSPDSSITFGYSSPNITAVANASGGLVHTLTGNVGIATASSGNINVVTANSTVKFSGSGATLTQDFGIGNLLLGSSGAITTGGANVGVGQNALNATTTGGSNVAVGSLAMQANTGGAANIAVGANTLLTFNPSSSATFTYNIAIGTNALDLLTTGTNCICLGRLSGSSYTSSESSNILISNVGTTAESNVTRIGTQGSGAGQQNKAFVAGIVGVTTSNSEMVTIDSTTGQLGAAAIPGGGGITTINGDSGSITGATVTVFANTATKNSGATVSFVNSSTTSTLNVSDTNGNTFIGNLAGNLSGLTGIRNVALGPFALNVITGNSNQNTAIGTSVLTGLTGGNTNCCIGDQAGVFLVTGSGNTLVGSTLAGGQYTSSESNNICIDSPGVTGDDKVIRIGDTQTSAFMKGITGVTVAASSPVAIDSNGQLSDLGFGTATNVLTSNGAGNSPTWQAAGGGGFTPVNWSVKLSGNVSNVTGDATPYQILYDTVTFDSATGYSAGTGLYTIPTTGIYQISITHFVFGGGVADTVFLGYLLINGATNVRLMDANAANLGLTTNGEFMQSATYLYSATAGDTIAAFVEVGNGAKDVGVAGGAESCLFSGFRVA